MRKANKALILGCSVLFTLGLLNFAGCSGSPESDPNNGGNGSGGSPVTYTTTDLEVTETDLGNYADSVVIAASYFSNMKEGDYLTVTTTASTTFTDYFQLAFKDTSNGWATFGSDGECTNATFSSEYTVFALNSAAQDTKFTPCADEIAILKASGVAIQGTGVVVKRVTLSIGSTSSSGSSGSSTPATEVTDSSATENTKKVYAYLKNIYGNKMLTGVMDCSWMSNTVKDKDPIDMEAKVYNTTGKYPALVGYDFSFLLKSDSKTWCNPTQVEEAETAWNKGSLVTFCWHWLDPTATSGNGASYKPDEIAFRIPYDESTGKLDESSENFTYIKNDLDTVASYLLQLQNDGVVVIWRPLHEAKGNCGLYPDQDTGEPTGTAWFWWGAGNSTTYDSSTGKYSVSEDEDLCAASYKALWKYMYTYFTETKGLHNLIWLWNGQGAKWYPGDDYCDLVGYDIYDSTNANGAGLSYYNNLMSWCNSSKMATISECGYIPSSTSVQSSTAKWLYYMVWCDDDALDDDTSDDNDNFWGGTAYNSTAAKTTNSYDTDFTVKRGDSDLKALFTSMGVSLTN